MRRAKGTEQWSDADYAEWRAQPWWKRYKLGLAPGWWAVALVSGVIALLAWWRVHPPSFP